MKEFEAFTIPHLLHDLLCKTISDSLLTADIFVFYKVYDKLSFCGNSTQRRCQKCSFVQQPVHVYQNEVSPQDKRFTLEKEMNISPGSII